MGRSFASETDARRVLRRLRFFPRLQRSLRKRYLRFIHGDNDFLAEYFGARFHVSWTDAVAREIALKTFERTQIERFVRACERIKPDLLVDIGAHNGLYSCILLKRKLVSRAVLFEPDRRNLARLRANLLINQIHENADVREVALGRAAGRLKLVPGPASNTGQSRLVESGGNGAGYDVNVVRLDDVLQLTGSVLAVKMDIEGHELAVLGGMERTLRLNCGLIQIETTDTREKVIAIMAGFGYTLAADFYWDLVFEKPRSV